MLNLLHQLLQLLIAIPPTATPPIHHNPLLLLLILLRHRAQNILQLLLGYFLADLARPRQHNEPVLDVGRARLFDEADAPEAVRGVGRQDLREDRRALVCCGGWLRLVCEG